MDSLLANYASSDDEEQEQSPEPANTQPSSKSTSSSSSGASIFSSLPPPRSSFSSLLPPPKSHLPHSDLSKPDSESQQFEVSDKPRLSSSIFPLPPPKSSIFSLLPPPKSHLRDPILSSSKPTYQEEQQFEVPDEPKSPSSNFSLPPPKSSIFSLLPPPKSQLPGPIISSSRPTHQGDHQFEVADKPKSSSSIFSRLPPPKSQNVDSFSLKSLPSAQPNPRKVVQLKLPVNPSMLKSRDSDDEEDDDEKEREGRKPAVETASVSSFLSSIPAPRNSSTLGALPSAAGSGRRSILEADAPTIRSNDSKDSKIGVKISAESNLGTYNGYENHNESISAPLGQAGSSIESAYGVEGDASGWVSSNTNYENSNSNTNYENYEGYTGYENYSYYEQQDGNWGGASTATAQSPMVQMDDSSLKIPRKRGRHDIPQEIIEVKQDELMKDRPREDQVKLTGIAFGPSYQPVSTSKGKPSKLHKRKHQIGTLYFDMRQKEMELAERRSKGLLTKAETHAKYGW